MNGNRCGEDGLALKCAFFCRNCEEGMTIELKARKRHRLQLKSPAAVL